MSNWQKIEDMPVVRRILRKAEDEIRNDTGVEVVLNIAAISLCGDDRKTIIQDVVASYFNTTWDLISGATRQPVLVNARHVFMWLLRQEGYTFKEIGKYCKRDHSTVLVAVKKITGFIEVGDDLANDIEKIKLLIPKKLRK